MEQETLSAIRQAELSAQQLCEDAAQQKQAIIEQANTEAKKTVEQMLTFTKAKSASALETARKQGEALQESALTQVRGELDELRAGAQSKRSEVLSAILSGLV